MTTYKEKELTLDVVRECSDCSVQRIYSTRYYQVLLSGLKD